MLQAAQVLGNNPNYVSYVPACGVPSHVTALHHRYSTDFPVSLYLEVHDVMPGITSVSLKPDAHLKAC